MTRSVATEAGGQGSLWLPSEFRHYPHVSPLQAAHGPQPQTHEQRGSAIRARAPQRGGWRAPRAQPREGGVSAALHEQQERHSARAVSPASPAASWQPLCFPPPAACAGAAANADQMQGAAKHQGVVAAAAAAPAVAWSLAALLPTAAAPGSRSPRRPPHDPLPAPDGPAGATTRPRRRHAATAAARWLGSCRSASWRRRQPSCRPWAAPPPPRATAARPPRRASGSSCCRRRLGRPRP